MISAWLIIPFIVLVWPDIDAILTATSVVRLAMIPVVKVHVIVYHVVDIVGSAMS